jgi:hypothetical protein
MDGYDYDVALSYAGEDRERADQLAFALKRRGARVFYDKDDAARLWGENLYTHLTDLYQNRARYCVALLSRHYAEKPWALRELAAAQARAFRQREPYLLPVRLDDAEIPGVLPTESFVSWSGDSSDTIAELVLARLHGGEPAAAPARRSWGRLDWRDLQADYFEAFDAADAATDSWDTLKRVYANIWLPEEDDTWSSTVTGGVFRLANRNHAGAVRYLYLRIADRDMGESPVSVEVRAQAMENVAGAGLIYRFDRAQSHYYCFVMGGGGQFRFYIRDGNGFRILYAGRSPQSRPGQFHKLGIVGSGPAMWLYLDDSLVKRVEDDTLPRGDTGVAGIGMGSFAFDNFTIYR